MTHNMTWKAFNNETPPLISEAMTIICLGDCLFTSGIDYLEISNESPPMMYLRVNVKLIYSELPMNYVWFISFFNPSTGEQKFSLTYLCLPIITDGL